MINPTEIDVCYRCQYHLPHVYDTDTDTSWVSPWCIKYDVYLHLWLTTPDPSEQYLMRYGECTYCDLFVPPLERRW